MIRVTPQQLAGRLAHCLAHHTADLQICQMKDLVLDSRRANRKHGNEVTLSVTERIALAVRGRPEAGPEVLVLVIPREVCDEYDLEHQDAPATAEAVPDG